MLDFAKHSTQPAVILAIVGWIERFLRNPTLLPQASMLSFPATAKIDSFVRLARCFHACYTDKSGICFKLRLPYSYFLSRIRAKNGY
jgi:hypothetical protein